MDGGSFSLNSKVWIKAKCQNYMLSKSQEAEAYITHPILGKHLVEITKALLEHQEISIVDIFRTPDDNNSIPA